MIRVVAQPTMRAATTQATSVLPIIATIQAADASTLGAIASELKDRGTSTAARPLETPRPSWERWWGRKFRPDDMPPAPVCVQPQDFAA